ncbi:hypothetical protein TNCV_1808921 [Trichonephila clavipes]|nr:hypothetical protein TNCV_1808921 [Trichonephila clavipes]
MTEKAFKRLLPLLQNLPSESSDALTDDTLAEEVPEKIICMNFRQILKETIKRLNKIQDAVAHVQEIHCQVIYSQFGLAIHQNDHQARRRFVEWAQNEIAVVPDFHKRILFSDEAHFWLNGYVNKQNCRIWSEANPQVYVETPLHPEKVTVWCALWASEILLQKTMKATTLQSMVIGIEP